jgi:ankyrin repeat protein
MEHKTLSSGGRNHKKEQQRLVVRKTMNWYSNWKQRRRNEEDDTIDHPQVYLSPEIYTSLWEQWSRRSDDAISDFDWDAVVDAVQRDPAVTHYFDGDRRNMLLLHFVCALHPPLHVVDLVLEANSEAVWSKSKNAGITPLMIACGRNASDEVIRRLLKDAKETIPLTDSSGYSAIHWACRGDVSASVMCILLMVDPTVAHRRIEGNNGGQSYVDGVTPTDILCQSKKGSLGFSSRQGNKLYLILWVRYYGGVINAGEGGNNNQIGSILHSALALKCNEDVTQFAWERHGSHAATIRDCYGNLPLHHAVQLPSSACDGIVAEIIKAFPEGASCKDASGRLPLHVALTNGYTWTKHGVKELFENYPSVISSKDEEHCLYPSLLSAAFSDVETTFALLREYPRVIGYSCTLDSKGPS